MPSASVKSGLAAMLVALLWLAWLSPVDAVFGGQTSRTKPRPAAPTRRLLMAHYMPWFQAKPFHAQWGWHWTMNHYDPDHVTDGRREAASHDRPLIGLYDSDDPDALECQALLMTLAGIDGVIFDWYGNDEFDDFGVNNRNTERMIPVLRRAGLRFAICYETHTIPREIEGKALAPADVVEHGRKLLAWMQANFFSAPNYLTLGGRPVLLTFGDPYYTDAQWQQIFADVTPKPLYFTESDRQAATATIGGFDWPLPAGGTEASFGEQDKFYARAQAWPLSIAAAFPRFDDIYAEAGVGPSYGHIDDRGGRTYADTLTKALQGRSPVVQVVTWNDWGEGTQIEPSVEFGFRDLETTQRLRRHYLDPTFAATPQDLRLPVRWYRLRKKYAAAPAVRAKLDAFFPLVVAGKMAQARTLLEKCEAP